MGLVRNLIEELLQTIFPGLVETINGIYQFFFQNVNKTFLDYKSNLSPEPGWASFEGLAAIFIGAVVLLVGVFAFLMVIRYVLDKLNKQDEFSREQKLAGAVGLYVLFQILFDALNPLTLAARIKVDIAVFSAILSNELSNYTVDMTGFTWGLGEPTWEFIIQVGLISTAISLIAWWYTDFVQWPDWVEFVIDTVPIWGPVGIYIYASIEGVQVFPLEGRLAFIAQLVVLIAVNIFIASLLVGGGYLFVKWQPVDLGVNPPKKLWMTHDGVTLTAFVAITASGFGGIIAWAFYKAWVLRNRGEIGSSSSGEVTPEPAGEP